MLLQLLIKQQMREKGLTWRQLGQLVGMDESSVKRLVNVSLRSFDCYKNVERILIAVDAFRFDSEKVNKLIKKELKNKQL